MFNKSAGSKKFPRPIIYVIDLTSHCCRGAAESVLSLQMQRILSFNGSVSRSRIARLENPQSFIYLFKCAVSVRTNISVVLQENFQRIFLTI